MGNAEGVQLSTMQTSNKVLGEVLNNKRNMETANQKNAEKVCSSHLKETHAELRL